METYISFINRGPCSSMVYSKASKSVQGPLQVILLNIFKATRSKESVMEWTYVYMS